MGFFDLNVPYIESPPSNTTQKTTRVKIVIKAMELGYCGIAYNRIIKGVMSDHDRCSISLLSLSSLLKLAPSLSSSVNFHRDLLGVPRTSPFRQYTRLTVCVDTLAQSQVLNSGNPVLKTYDIVAVRPLNQSAFDHACEKAEVDIISINFGEKLPFRVKHPMVKAAIERGVYFELTYSDLILDVQLRRHMISNAKLLVDWTRGKNLIFSSGAFSVNEIRGPYDVANLLSLLGLSMERAKALVSKNCRTLLTNALRKKHFHKETIRVEAISSGQQLSSKEPWSGNWLKWDPISSGDGDLQLDDMEKSFTASSKESKTVKAFDFASVVSGIPSQGFQVKDLTSGTQAMSQSLDTGEKILSATDQVEISVTTNGVSGQQSRLNLLPETNQTSLDNAPSKHQALSTSQDTGKLGLTSDLAENIIGRTHTAPSEEQLKSPNVPDKLFAENKPEGHDQNSQNCISSHAVDVVLSKEIVKCQILTRDVELDALWNADAALEGVSPCDTFDFPACHSEKSKSLGSFDADLGSRNVTIGEVRMDMDVKAQEDTSLPLDDVSLQENVKHFVDDQVNSDQNLLQEFNIEIAKDDTSVVSHETLEDVKMEEQPNVNQMRETGDCGLVADRIPVLDSSNLITIKDDSAVANCRPQDVIRMEGEQRRGEQFREPVVGVIADQILNMNSCIEVKDGPSVASPGAPEDEKMEEQIHGEADSGVDHLTLVQCVSGKTRAKPRVPRGTHLFPLKRLLSPISFKKKPRKLKRRIKKA